MQMKKTFRSRVRHAQTREGVTSTYHYRVTLKLPPCAEGRLPMSEVRLMLTWEFLSPPSQLFLAPKARHVQLCLLQVPHSFFICNWFGFEPFQTCAQFLWQGRSTYSIITGINAISKRESNSNTQILGYLFKILSSI